MRWNRLLNNARSFLQQGLSPGALAMSTTIGLLLGLFPVLGVTTAAMTLLSLRFRLNLAVMLAVSYVIYPLQLLLIIPYIRLGEWLSGAPRLPLSPEHLLSAFQSDFLAAMQQLGMANLHAVSAWALLSLPTGFTLYFLLRFFFRRWQRRTA
jgi:uncharacterized protein (DUF2062 family)